MQTESGAEAWKQGIRINGLFGFLRSVQMAGRAAARGRGARRIFNFPGMPGRRNGGRKVTEQLQSIWYNFILNVKGNFNPIVDLLDILVVTFLIYEAISLVRQTRTAQLAKGIIAVLLAYAVANLLGMRTLAWLINSIMSFGIIALVVVFQPELRRADTSLTKFDIDSISPAYVDVTFAQIGTQKFTVEVEASVDPAEGYYLGEKQASPAEVTLRGPVDELARVARVVARVESDEKRDRTMLDSAALEFLDADGHAITDSSITVLEGEQVEVTIPVLKLKEVPLKFEFSNVPAGYDPAELNASISPATIRIAGAADTVDGIESVNAGFINLARVQLGKAETLKIQLSEGLVNVDDVQEATVTFDTSGYGEPRAITVSDIRVVNAPSGVDVKVITESINNVTLVGEAEELAAISPSDVIAQVDASAQNITVKGSGQQQFSAQIIVTGTKTVFATGAYSVLCDITVK